MQRGGGNAVRRERRERRERWKPGNRRHRRHRRERRETTRGDRATSSILATALFGGETNSFVGHRGLWQNDGITRDLYRRLRLANDASQNLLIRCRPLGVPTAPGDAGVPGGVGVPGALGGLRLSLLADKTEALIVKGGIS